MPANRPAQLIVTRVRVKPVVGTAATAPASSGRVTQVRLQLAFVETQEQLGRDPQAGILPMSITPTTPSQPSSFSGSTGRGHRCGRGAAAG